MTSPDYKAIANKILDLLKADTTLSAAVKKWCFGIPVRFDLFPLVYVKWVGGPVEPGTAAKEVYEIRFHVAVIDRHHDEDVAEKTVMDYSVKIDDVLDANPTLGGNVDDSWVERIEAEATAMGDYAVSGVRFTLYTRKIVT
ncbi:MAG: hypothetical protein ACE5OY_08995 [Candidatus Bathyarchaeia archaeon]